MNDTHTNKHMHRYWHTTGYGQVYTIFADMNMSRYSHIDRYRCIFTDINIWSDIYILTDT